MLNKLADLEELLSSYRFHFGNEDELQSAIGDVLDEQGISHQREHRLGGDRIDFLLDGGLGIECKVDGGPAALASQLLRYASHDEIKSLALATTRHTHLRLACQRSLQGVPFRVIWLARP